MSTQYLPHTFKLIEDKYNIKNYVKGIQTTTELSEIFRYIKNREIGITDIGKRLMNKCPYIVNFDFSEVALSGKKPILYSVKDFSDQEETEVKMYLVSFLTNKLESIKDNLTSFDIQKFNALKLNAYKAKLFTTDISEDILSDPFHMSLLWGSYVTYLITKDIFKAPVGEVISNTKNTLLKRLEECKISQEEIDILKEQEEWDSKYIDLVKPPLTESYTYTKVNKQGSTDNDKFGYIFKTSKSLETKFRLKNNGSQLSCMSDILYSDNVPFSFNINVFFEHTLCEQEEGNLIVNIFSTSWVNSEEPIKLDTTDKSSLYICSSNKDNYYTRLEIINALEIKTDQDSKKVYDIKSTLSDSDNEVLQKLLGPNVRLNDILENPSKFVSSNRLKNNLFFAGIPMTASLKSSMSGYAESGLSIKDKTNIFNLIFDSLIRQGLKIEKEAALQEVKIKKDIEGAMKFTSKFIEANKMQYLNREIDTVLIAYWSNNDDDFLLFKEFMENLSDKDKSSVKIFNKFEENTYTLDIHNRTLKIRLIKCNTHTMATPIEPLRGGIKVTPKDIELKAADCRDIIVSEFKKHEVLIPNRDKSTIITNIFEIPDYQNRLNTKAFDPCYSIRVAFAKLGLNIQVLNETLSIKNKRANRVNKINELKTELAKNQCDLEELTKSIDYLTDEESLSEAKSKIKKAKKLTKDAEGNLDKALKSNDTLISKEDKNRVEVFKSCLLDCLSKKGFTINLKTDKIHQGVLTVYSFAIVEIAKESNILLLTKLNNNGIFVKDISSCKANGNINSDWVTLENFPNIANRYIEGCRNNKIEEHQIWSRIENEINLDNSKENVLLISASERKILKDLTNSKITKGIRILKTIPNLSVVRINDFNDAPFGAVYKIETGDANEIVLKPSNNQGLFKKNRYIYYDKSERGDTIQASLSSTKFEKNQFLAARRSIEFCIVSNHLECNDSIASLTSALRKLTVAFGTSTNRPYTLHIIEQLSKEYK